MRTAGIDIGSRTVKLVILEDGRLVLSRVRENSFDPLAVCREILTGERFDAIVAAGYGRHLFTERIAGRAITEIKAAALGARHVVPFCGTVLDIGGQDSKAIALDGRGAVRRFEMNDKCAAGTGRFLETMTLALGCGLDDFSRLAEQVDVSASACPTLNSTCTVFAESEVVSLIAKGESRGAIARSIVEAVAGRAAALVRQVDTPEALVLIGGLARCAALRQALSRRLACPVQAPDGAQTVVALGCALAAMEENR